MISAKGVKNQHNFIEKVSPPDAIQVETHRRQKVNKFNFYLHLKEFNNRFLFWIPLHLSLSPFLS